LDFKLTLQDRKGQLWKCQYLYINSSHFISYLYLWARSSQGKDFAVQFVCNQSMRQNEVYFIWTTIGDFSVYLPITTINYICNNNSMPLLIFCNWRKKNHRFVLYWVLFF